MRLSARLYEGGGRYAVETSNDGLEIKREWGGEWQVKVHVPVYVELICDDSPAAMDNLRDTLSWLMEEVSKMRKDREPEPQSTSR